MKNSALFLLAIFAFGLYSCSSDDDNSFSSGDIVGSWLIDELVMDMNYGDAESHMEMKGMTDEDYWEFKSDQTYSIHVSGETWQEGYVIMDGEEIPIDEDDDIELDDGSGTWEMMDNKIMIIDEGEETLFTIEKMTSSTLKLKANESDLDYDEEDNMQMEMRLTLKRK